jgi:DNA (cytosine-5)-methyltransferase 1
MKVLNLYAGLGGNRKRWQNVEVTAVELDEKIAAVYQDFNPNDKVIVTDAHAFLLKHFEEFDFIWDSAPCQSHSMMMLGTRHKTRRYPDMALYQEIILLKHFFKGYWVVENVNPYYEPLIKPTKILGRHLFWSNFKITPFLEDTSFPNFINTGTVAESKQLKKWLDIQYEGNIYYNGNHDPNQVLRNCVHPKLGLHVFECAMNINKPVKPIGLFQ